MPDELPYTIELWDPETERPEEVKGRLGSSILAQAAFDAACREYPRYLVVLRRKAHVMARSDRQK